MKKREGITLIALVITIIILLILAGVTLNLTLGDNGIFKLAQSASRNYLNASEQEKDTIAYYENKIAQHIEGDRNTQIWTKYMMNENGYVIGNEEINLPQNFTELQVKVSVNVSSIRSCIFI